MKNILLILFGVFSFCSYAQKEERLISQEMMKFPKDFPDGETFILNQEELEKKYSNNYSLYATLKEQFFNFHSLQKLYN